MADNWFDLVEQVLRSGGSQAGFDFLIQKFRDEKNYPALFEARLMKKRHELGLPLIQTDSWAASLPKEKQRDYEQGTVDAAREVGSLFLATGDIARAWPYFRAIGETAPVAQAIDQVEAGEGIDPAIEIAFYEAVNPRKGFELILENHGICRAITCFGQYPVAEGREESAGLLVSTLHRELLASLKRVVAQQEGQAPETENISELVAGRDWLFEGNAYYIDTSHVSSVVQLSVQLEDPRTLALAVELTDYGKRLGTMFQFRGQPPFEDVYVDHGVYLRALLGEHVDDAVAHFRTKVSQSDPDEVGSTPAQALVGLLARLKRYSEAIDVSLQYLADVDARELACQSVVQLCELAGDYGRLRELARERGDLLSFTAAMLQSPRVSVKQSGAGEGP